MLAVQKNWPRLFTQVNGNDFNLNSLVSKRYLTRYQWDVGSHAQRPRRQSLYSPHTGPEHSLIKLLNSVKIQATTTNF